MITKDKPTKKKKPILPQETRARQCDNALRDRRIKELGDNACIKYAQDVLNGNIIAGELIKLACKRFLNDFGNPLLEWHQKDLNKCKKLFRMLKHSKGSMANKPFVLEPWQEWIVGNLLCWYWSDKEPERKGTRRFTEAYIQVSRKQGKSFLMSALAIYYLFSTIKEGGEIVCGANNAEQAHILYDQCKEFSEQLDPKQKLLEIYRNQIKCGNAKLHVINAEAKTKDGLNVSAFFVDEVEEARDFKLRDVLKSSQGARTNPLGVCICTAGFDRSYPAYDLRCANVDILYGVNESNDMFSAIYELDKSDDWTDISCYQKAAPNLGKSVNLAWYKSFLEQCKANPNERSNFITKNLNMWIDSDTEWLPSEHVLACTKDFDFNTILLEADKYECYVGFDLSSVEDMSSVAYCFRHMETNEIYFLVKYYLPQETIKRSRNRELYKKWQSLGMLTATPGNTIDYDIIYNDIIDTEQKLPNGISVIYYDAWNSTSIVLKLQNEGGLPLKPMSQSLGSFNKATKEFIRGVLAHTLNLPNNPILRWNISSSKLKTDQNANIKPIKASDTNDRAGKIDGLIATLEAYSSCLDNAFNDFSVVS